MELETGRGALALWGAVDCQMLCLAAQIGGHASALTSSSTGMSRESVQHEAASHGTAVFVPLSSDGAAGVQVQDRGRLAAVLTPDIEKRGG